MKKPLTPKILSDHNNDFVKNLIYIYSMQTFIFSEINKTSRDKDKSKIEYYGPLASALGYIIHIGNYESLKTKEKIITYRGMKVKNE